MSKQKKKAGLPAKNIEVYHVKEDPKTSNTKAKSKPKNKWGWGVIKRIKKKGANEIYGAGGFDTKASAQRAARQHNKSMKAPLLMIDREKNQFFV